MRENLSSCFAVLPVQNPSVTVANQGLSKWGPPRPAFTERWAFPEATELHSLNFYQIGYFYTTDNFGVCTGLQEVWTLTLRSDWGLEVSKSLKTHASTSGFAAIAVSPYLNDM